MGMKEKRRTKESRVQGRPSAVLMSQLATSEVIESCLQ